MSKVEKEEGLHAERRPFRPFSAEEVPHTKARRKSVGRKRVLSRMARESSKVKGLKVNGGEGKKGFALAGFLLNQGNSDDANAPPESSRNQAIRVEIRLIPVPFRRVGDFCLPADGRPGPGLWNAG